MEEPQKKEKQVRMNILPISPETTEDSKVDLIILQPISYLFLNSSITNKINITNLSNNRIKLNQEDLRCSEKFIKNLCINSMTLNLFHKVFNLIRFPPLECGLINKLLLPYNLPTPLNLETKELSEDHIPLSMIFILSITNLILISIYKMMNIWLKLVADVVQQSISCISVQVSSEWVTKLVEMEDILKREKS